MENISINTKSGVSSQNKIATTVIVAMTFIIGIVYIGILFFLLGTKELKTADIIKFIQLFDVILAGLAVISCMLCYNSTKKEELFILSLLYIVFLVDISLGNMDSMSLNDKTIYMNNYIIMATSLFRIIILVISVLPVKGIKALIVNNKLKSISIVVGISLLIGILKINDLIPDGFRNTDHFVSYNVFLVIVYAIVSIIYLIKSIRYKEYIYSVISASTFLFTIKWIYAIIDVKYPMENIKLASISITYIGFIIFIGGVIFELILSIKKNKELENELIIFKKIADESRYSCILIYDEYSNIVYANDEAKHYTSNESKITNKELDKITKEKTKEIDKDKIKEINNHLLQVGHWKGIIEIPSIDVTLSCSIQKIYLDDNKNTVVIFTDISDKLRAKTCILEYEKMKNQEQIRNEFFANISHELRTPLNIFYSTIQLLDMKSKANTVEFNEVYASHKQCLKINCQRMLRLINNIVDITKIDVGFTKPQFINCDIVRLVEDLTLSVVNYASPKDINIIFDTDTEEQIIKCDPNMMERVMLNLLSNAIKFTRNNGNILVNMYADSKWVHITVKDDGIGIPIEVQGTIFERFVQSDKSLTRLNEGSGIGLSIVKSIVELNDGQIYLDSDGKSGTEIEILLPNIKLEGYTMREEVYQVDVQKIELELSDIYELYQ